MLLSKFLFRCSLIHLCRFVIALSERICFSSQRHVGLCRSSERSASPGQKRLTMDAKWGWGWWWLEKEPGMFFATNISKVTVQLKIQPWLSNLLFLLAWTPPKSQMNLQRSCGPWLRASGLQIWDWEKKERKIKTRLNNINNNKKKPKIDDKMCLKGKLMNFCSSFWWGFFWGNVSLGNNILLPSLFKFRTIKNNII